MKVDDEGLIKDDEEFEENERLGEKNIFAYSVKNKILAIQHNNNGMGIQPFEDMLNNNLPILQNRVKFNVIIKEDHLTEEIENFTKLEFNIAKYNNAKNYPLLKLNDFEKLGVGKIKMILHSVNVFNTVSICNIISTFKQNKDELGITTLKCESLLGGENVVLNFLPNKAKLKKEISLDKGKKFDYTMRKNLILELLEEFLKI